MTAIASNSNGFSFRRVWAYACYYMPKLKWELLIYAGVSLICGILNLLPVHEDLQVALFVGTWTILPLIFYCGPLIFATGPDTKIIDRLIPVSAAEKLTFYYIYTLLVIPVVVYLIPLCADWIYFSCPSVQTQKMMALYEAKFGELGVLGLMNLTGAVFITMACLFSVLHARQSRMLMGIVAVVVANIIVGFLGAILGVVTSIKAFKMGLEDGIAGKTQCTEDVTERVVKEVMAELSTSNPLSLVLLGVIIVLIIVTGWMTYRTIRKRNL